jgi:hypothetical protein
VSQHPPTKGSRFLHESVLQVALGKPGMQAAGVQASTAWQALPQLPQFGIVLIGMQTSLQQPSPDWQSVASSQETMTMHSPESSLHNPGSQQLIPRQHSMPSLQKEVQTLLMQSSQSPQTPESVHGTGAEVVVVGGAAVVVAGGAAVVVAGAGVVVVVVVGGG